MQSIWIAKIAAKCDNFSETTKKEPEGERNMSDRVPTNNEIIVVINDTLIISMMDTEIHYAIEVQRISMD